MPTYEYRCPDGHDFEHFVLKISLAAAELPCPVCGKMAQRRISAGGGLVFKGSGFYITDYGKDGKKGSPAASTSSKGEKAQGDTSKSDSAKSEPATGGAPKSEAPAPKSSTPKSPSSDK
jgi:putative FmdB family regulatory protein